MSHVRPSIPSLESTWARLCDDPLDFTGATFLVLTLVLVPHFVRTPVLLTAYCLLVVAGLVVHALRRRAGYWFALGLVLLAFDVHDYPFAHNSLFAWTYATLGWGACRLAPDPPAAARRGAAALLATIFGWATASKLGSPDFLSGELYRYLLLSDDVFAGLGAVSPAQLHENQAAIEAVMHPLGPTAQPLEPVALAPWVIDAMVWATVALEASVGALFAMSTLGWRTAGRLADPALMVFLVGCYALVPAMTFVCVLWALGTLHARTDRTRMIYFAILAGLWLWHGGGLPFLLAR